MKVRISSKLGRLRQWQGGQEERGEREMAGFNRPIGELRVGAEVMEKSAVKMREELGLLVGVVGGRNQL